MDPQEPKKTSLEKIEKKKKENLHIPKWARDAGNFLLGRSPESNLITIATESPFKNFQKDIQHKILDLLQQARVAQNLPNTTRILNTLAQTDKSLNHLINDPNYCLQTIKYLSEKFNCSNYHAGIYLQTKQAKEQSRIQKQLLDLCQEKNPNEWLFVLLCNQGADLYFTYSYKNKTLTPLMIAMENNSNMIHYLIDVGVSVNHASKDGLTPLMFMVEENNLYMTQFLLSQQTININQKDAAGNTVLHLLLKKDSPSLRMLQLLLQYGADKTITNNAGDTPLKLSANNPEIMKILQNTSAENRP